MRLHLAHLDLVSLRLVVLCADRGSLAAAARCAHLSLSTASHRLKALEDHLGCRLFDRDPRGMRSTHAGEQVIAHARNILEQIGQLQITLLRLEHAHPGTYVPAPGKLAGDAVSTSARGVEKNPMPAFTHAHGARLP